MEQERECLVQTVEVTHGGQVHRATYFIENHIIHAQIGDHAVSNPIGTGSAAATVKALLTAHLNRRSRVKDQARRWLSSRWLSNEEPGHGA